MILGDVVAETVEGVDVAPPVRQYLDREIQVDTVADQRFDLLASSASDLADALSACAYKDALLAFALDVEDGSNVHGRPRLAVFLDLASHAVGHFVIELLQRRLPNELGSKESHRLRADLIIRIQEWALWDHRSEVLEQLVDAGAGGSGDGVGGR